MIGRRIGYSLLTLVAWVAFIWTDNRVALFLGILLTVLPICTLVMLVVASRRVKFDCKVSDVCMRGGVLKIEMRLGVRPRFFVGRAEVAMKIQNTTFDRTENKTYTFYDVNNRPVTYDFFGSHSGRVRMEVSQIKLIDLFGLCSLSVKYNHEYESIVSPVLYENLPISLGFGSRFAAIGERVDTNQKGFDRSEIFAIREYVAGDSLNAVHWKLSGKFNDLKVKDFASAGDYKLLIMVDLSRNKYDVSASDETLNKILDIAISLSNSYWETGVFHCVGWIDNGLLHYVGVNDNESFLRMVYSLMSAKVTNDDINAAGYLVSGKETNKFTKFIFISAAAQIEELNGVDGEITAISLSGHIDESVFDTIRMIDLKPEYVETALMRGFS